MELAAKAMANFSNDPAVVWALNIEAIFLDGFSLLTVLLKLLLLLLLLGAAAAAAAAAAAGDAVAAGDGGAAAGSISIRSDETVFVCGTMLVAASSAACLAAWFPKAQLTDDPPLYFFPHPGRLQMYHNTFPVRSAFSTVKHWRVCLRWEDMEVKKKNEKVSARKENVSILCHTTHDYRDE
jgi:hypothetical protein